MLKPIVVPLDGSPLGEHALVPAVTLAKRLNAELHLVRVRESDSPNHRLHADAVQSDDPYLDELSSRVDVRPELLKLVSLEGQVASTLIEYAHAANARMIVMASRRHDGLHRPVLSSVTDHVIRHAALPVLVCGPETTAIQRHTDWDCERILIPLDGSALARQIVPHAAYLAAGLNSKITLLRVLSEPARTVGWPAIPFDREAEAISAQRDARADLEGIARVLRDAGVDVDTHVVQTTLPTADAIENEALDADLIALATRGRGLAKRLAFGSVAHELIRRVVAPMLVLAPDDVSESEPFTLKLDAS